ncbi:hypothetical protein B566_EDAN010151 [Ephemera danica]|nr:hypothetical protein B566_EDAN010151 [Ephemera danica]
MSPFSLVAFVRVALIMVSVLGQGIAMADLNSPFWTSANDIEKEGTWIWRSTGQPVTFTDWEESEPSNHKNIEHCMFIGSWGKMFQNGTTFHARGNYILFVINQCKSNLITLHE